MEDPGSVTAGPVELRGTVSAGPPMVTTVLFVVDVSGSTDAPVGLDCDGNGVLNEAGDDLNGDGSVGDTLDCEIAGVKALNTSLQSSPGAVQVSLESFGPTAHAVNLDPAASPPMLFASPSDTGGGSQPRLVTAATQLRRGAPGTNIDAAIGTALDTLSRAPAGPRYIMFFNDGRGASVSDATVSALRGSGVKLRAFGVGNPLACRPSGSLVALSGSTGDTCVLVSSPAGLAAELTSAQPLSVNAVQLNIGGTTVPARVDISGGWRAPVSLGAGTYRVTATGTFSSGATVSTSRTITVTPPAALPPGSVQVTPLPAGTVVPGWTLVRTRVLVRRPAPMWAELPRTVTGSVGAARPSTPLIAALDGATVILQGRTGPEGAWRKVSASARVKAGKYSLTWSRQARIHQLRVALLPYKTFAATAAGVPKAHISACTLARSGSGFTIRCRTTAANGTKVRLLKSGQVVHRSVVRSHRLTVIGTGKVAAHVVSVDVSRLVQYRLRLSG
jgi:hypothetical protein